MLQNWNCLWEQPYPLPLPGAPLADQGPSPQEGDRSVSALPAEKQPCSPPLVVPEDDYQWLILL